MKAAIDNLLRQEKIVKEDTVYFPIGNEINSFPITAGDFFRIETADQWREESWVESIFQQKMRDREDMVCRKLRDMADEMKTLICEIKKDDPSGYGHMAELRSLRFVKHSIENALDELRQNYKAEVEREMVKLYGIRDRKILVYKNTVWLGSFEDLRHRIPSFERIRLKWFKKTPLLLRNIGTIQNAVAGDIPIGVVGGPCLFGLYEMEIIVRHKDGQVFSYDFSSGHHYDRAGQKTYEFADHVKDHAGDIQSIRFANRKKGVTEQEHDSLEILFDVGTALGAKVAAVIPDISYLKYLSTVIAPLDDAMKSQILEEFRKEVHKIADMYLKRIGEMKEKYPDVEVRVLHDRDKEACKTFYAGREKFFMNSGLIRRLTAKREKADVVFDYISMLALPYYFWKTPQVIQVDNLDETDSYRKCRKIHKGAFDLSAILYPEKLSANGEQTIFNAPLSFKRYT